MSRVVRSLAILSGLALLGAGALAAWVWLSRPHVGGTAEFPLIETRVIYNVDDAGVGDLNGDGRLDRWTTNHSAAQWIALGGGAEDAAFDLGLAQDPALPGMEQGTEAVPPLRPIRLFMDETRFVVEADGVGDQRIRGSFTIPWKTRFEARGDARTTVATCDTVPNCHRIDFDLGEGGRAIIEPVPPPSDGFAITIELAPDVALDQVQLGTRALQPPEHRFVYASRDRHGLALADPDGDGAPDLFVSRGGARGELGSIEPEARDEWFAWTGTGFAVRIAETGIEKAGCPGRQTSWIDADGDGRLDLYQVCGRAGPPNDMFPNRLYRQLEGGRFAEAASALGLDLPGAGSFRFFRDARPEAALSMLWATPAEVSLHVRRAGRFEKVWSLPRKGGVLDRIALTDLEGDGLWDAMIFSPRGNILFRPAAEAPQVLDLQAFGLPSASGDGFFLDVNGDGARDLVALPQGLFLGSSGGFRRSDALDLGWVGAGGDVRFALFDAEADGDADLWLLKQNGAHLPRLLRAFQSRLPEQVRLGMERVLGRETLRQDYWLAVLYENRMGAGGQQTVLVVDDLGRPVGPGVPVVVTTVAADGSDPQVEDHLTGEADSARLSQTRDEIIVSLPGGRRILQVEPIAQPD